MVIIEYYLVGSRYPIYRDEHAVSDRPDIEVIIHRVLTKRYGAGCYGMVTKGQWTYTVTLYGAVAGRVSVTFRSSGCPHS